MKKLIIILTVGLLAFIPDNVDLTNVPAYSGNLAGMEVIGVMTNGNSRTLRKFQAADFYNRAYHTGVQSISTISGLQSALSGLQPLLQSGTNIKTINGVPLLGSGDITVSGLDTTQTAIKLILNKYFADHQPTTDTYFSANNFETVGGTIYLYGGNTNNTVSPGSSVAGNMSVAIAGHTRRSKITITVTSSITLTDNLDLVIVTFGQTYLNAPGPELTPATTFPQQLKIHAITTTSLSISATGSGTLAAGTYILYLGVEAL